MLGYTFDMYTPQFPANSCVSIIGCNYDVIPRGKNRGKCRGGRYFPVLIQNKTTKY